MPHRRQHQGSFREPVDRLVPRLGDAERRFKTAERSENEEKRRARCHAYHNETLSEQSAD